MLSRVGATSLAATFPLNNTLTLLNLSCTGIEDKGAVAIATSLKTSRLPLASLILDGNSIEVNI